MLEGFYGIYFTGAIGSGMGLLTIKSGVVCGVDAAGGIYDGKYVHNAGTGLNDVQLRLTLPPGASLVTGALAGAQPMTMNMNLSLPDNLGGEQPVRVNTPTGPVNVIFRKIREFPATN